MAHAPPKLPAPPQGVIASLVGGFEAVNARLELILLPLLLDLFLWLGPHLSIQPLIDRFLLDLAQLVPTDADATALQNWTILQETLSEYGRTFNLFSALSTAPLGLPSLLAPRGSSATPLGPPVIWYVDSLPLYLLLVGALMLIGLFLAALYFGGIAQQVRDRRLSVVRLLRQVWGDWARLTALGVLVIIVLVVLGLPVMLVSLIASLLNPLVGGLVWVVGLTLILWAVFYGSFALHGMLLQRRGLFRALWDSLQLVQVNLPHAAGLFVLIVLINLGLAAVWNLPGEQSWYMLLGLGGHALISTALVASTFVFYQDRFRWWMEMRQSLQARTEAERRGLNRKA